MKPVLYTLLAIAAFWIMVFLGMNTVRTIVPSDAPPLDAGTTIFDMGSSDETVLIMGSTGTADLITIAVTFVEGRD